MSRNSFKATVTIISGFAGAALTVCFGTQLGEPTLCLVPPLLLLLWCGILYYLQEGRNLYRTNLVSAGAVTGAWTVLVLGALWETFTHDPRGGLVLTTVFAMIPVCSIAVIVYEIKPPPIEQNRQTVHS